MIWIGLASCGDKISQEYNTLGYQIIDSGKQQSDSAESLPPSSPPESQIIVYPQNRSIREGAHIALRAVHHIDNYPPEDLQASWTSSQPGVIEIDGQTAHARSEGTAILTVDTQFGSQDVELTVHNRESITVQVIHADDMSPVEGMTVTANNSVVGNTNQLGELEILATNINSISIYQQGYVPVSVLSITGSHITLPAIPNSETMRPMGEISGQVDFTAMTAPDFNEVSVALSLPQHRNILSVTLNDLFRSTRSVDIFGTEANIPSSISLRDYDETYELVSHIDTPSITTFATNVPALSLTEAANEADPFELLAPLIPNMRVDLSTEQPQPKHSLFARSAPTLSALPIEYHNPNVLLLHGIQNASSAFKVCGLGIAETNDSIVYTSSEIQCNGAQHFVAGILESENEQHRSSMVQSTTDSFPSFLETPGLVQFDPSSKAVSMRLSTEAQLVQIWIQAADGTQRLIYVPPHYNEFEMPTPPFPMGYGNTTWSIQQLRLNQDTYHDWLTENENTVFHADKQALASGLIRFQLIQ